MSSSDVEIHLVAVDEASSVFEAAGARMSATFQNVEGQTQNLVSTTDAATSQISLDYDDVKFSMDALDEEQGKMNGGFGNSVMAMNAVALSGANLFMSFERVQNAQVMVDRSNLMVQRSTETLEKAQTAYNVALEKYGPNSSQAKDALDKLNIAQEAHRVALERADMASRNYNNSIVTSAVTVIPSLIAIVGSLSKLEESETLTKIASTAASYGHAAAEQVEAAATYVASGAMAVFNAICNANPILLVVTAIAALAAIFITAYNYCTPFRDAVNQLGAALSGAFMTAVNAVRDGLTWLWTNVFKPLGEFIANVFVANITVLMDVLNFLWNNVLVPLGTFIQNTFGAVLKFITDLFARLYDIVKPIVDAINTVKDVMGGFVNTISGALNSAGNAIQGFIGSICFAHALAKAADDSKTTMDNWSSMVQDHMGKGLDAIKSFNASAEIAGTPTVVGAGVAAGASVGLLAAGARPVNNFYFSQPLVQIQGSADRATAQLAANMVKEQLQNVIIQPTSPSSLLRKQVRIAR